MKVRVIAYETGHYESITNKEFDIKNATEYGTLMEFITDTFLNDEVDTIRIVKVKD